MSVCVCVLVCVALPMVVGAWSMAGALQQLFVISKLRRCHVILCMHYVLNVHMYVCPCVLVHPPDCACVKVIWTRWAGACEERRVGFLFCCLDGHG